MTLAPHIPAPLRPGQTGGSVRLILQAEGAAVLALSTAAYATAGFGWLPFVLFFLLPDVAMLGYLRDTRLGALNYNLGHTYVLPLALIAMGHALALPLALAAGLIWTAHIGFDRLMGYGLKYDRHFQATHLMAKA
jgi:hypothetical protein